MALAGLARWTMHHGYDQNGDLPMFWPMTFGVQSEELESLEWVNARTTMIFGSNVIQTRLPDAHHLLEAKRRGRVVVVDPDFCSTAAKADEWLPIKADTDAALALGMARVMVERQLYDADFLRDFTDFPILVRQDNGKRLLAGDVGNAGGGGRRLARSPTTAGCSSSAAAASSASLIRKIWPRPGPTSRGSSR